jgi:galactokinase
LTKNLEKSNETSLKQIADIAYTAERKILQINCGQMDQYASALGNVLYLDCSVEPAKPCFLRPKLNLPLVIGDTGQAKNTQRILA